MAYPANLAPQTPSSTYDIVAMTTSPLFVLLKGFTFATVVGVKSRCRIDMPFYNGSVTRDNINAGTIGRGPMSVLKTASAGGASTSITTVVNGDLVINDTGGATSTQTVVADEIATMMQQDDNFTHVAPHQNVLGVSLIRYFDGATASGNVLAEYPADQWRGESDRIPQTYGSSPPVYTTS